MNFSPKSGNCAISCAPNISASISHTCKNAVKQKEPLRCAMKISVPNFQKYRVITYRFRKIIA